MKLVSVIEISPTFVEMIICQSDKESYEIIEKIREEVDLFKGYQKTKKITFDKSKRLCEILSKMKELSLNYGCKKILTLTTSSFNNIKNVPFLLDQIEIHTGLKVETSRLLEKKKLLFKKFLKFKNELITQRKNTLIVNIGTSTTDLVFLHNRKLIKNQIISTGGYKIAEFVENENLSPDEASLFLEDYIYNYLLEIKKKIGRKNIFKLVLLGEVGMFFEGKDSSPVIDVNRKYIKNVLGSMEGRSFKNLASEYNVSKISFIKGMMELTMVKYITEEFDIENLSILSYDNKEFLVYEDLFPSKKAQLDDQLWKLTLEASKALGSKYNYNMEHSKFTSKLSTDLFNTLSLKSKIPLRISKYLEVANYLHDTGKYINFKEHNKHSEYIAKNSFIFGLNEKELEFISFLCYAHGKDIDDYSTYFEIIPNEEKLYVLKSLAILNIAVALDRSKKQKAIKIDLTLNEKELRIEVYTRDKFLIEKLFFNKQVKFFKEVFGITPVLHINRRYYGENI